MPLATRIRIIACPPGEAPLNVRLAWVGLELPLAPGRTGRQLAMTSGVVSAPRGLWQRIAALFLARYGVQTGYSVNALEAVNLLQAKDPVGRRVVARALRPPARRQAVVPLSDGLVPGAPLSSTCRRSGSPPGLP
jgi:hypothetical protein